MSSLSHKLGGFHFNAKRVTEEHIKEFSITKTATSFESSAAELFRLLTHHNCIQASWSPEK
jgi:hypothetical protein